jgi:CheY-like chemotaxis protein
MDPPATTVMIVDDDHDIRSILAEVLEDEGYRVAAAANGVEALGQLRSGDPLPGVILLDLMMPFMDGWAFRAVQRDDPSLARIPVLVLTANAGAESQFEPLHAAGFVRKPVDLDELLAAVARHCPS